MVGVVVWTCAGLVVLDILLGLGFRYPDDPKRLVVGTLVQYFDYGRSTEGKLRRMTRQDKAQTAPITLAGWYDPLVSVFSGPETEGNIVTIYGMSHADLLGQAVGRQELGWTARRVTAPGATINWSYGAFLRDTKKRQSKAVVLAVMSVGVPGINSTTAATASADGQIPYTADRIVLSGDRAERIKPPFESFEGYVEHLYSDDKWNSYRDFLANYDALYDPWAFVQSPLDHSVLLRLLRRAYVQNERLKLQTRSLSRTQFVADSDAVRTANWIVEDFVRVARLEGKIPVIYIVNNLGYSDVVRRSLAPSLDKTRVAVLDSNDLASSMDPANYLPDSHFKDTVDDSLARKLIDIIDAKLKAEAAPSSPNGNAAIN